MGKIVLFVCLFASLSLAMLVDTTDAIYLRNRIIVEVTPAVQDLAINNSNGIVSTGHVSFDALLNRYDAKQMVKEFPMSRPSSETGKPVDISRYYIIYFNKDIELDRALADFGSDAIVNHVEPDCICPVDVIPNDPFWNFLWHLNNANDHDVDAPEAWDIEKGNDAVILTVADTGMDYEHPDLIDKVWHNPGEIPDNGIDDDGNGYVDDWLGWDWVTGVSGWPGEDCQVPDNDPMDFNGHGTHCSGITSATVDNGIGVAGVCWYNKIMGLRIGYSGSSGGQEVGYVLMGAAAQAITYATDQGSTAVNCSWGNNNTGGLGAALDYAVASGVLISVAAGNNNNQNPTYISSRGDCLSVAATDNQDHKASFSSYGTWVDVSAPGVNIYSTYRQHYGAHTYTTMSGTSMASPMCVGASGILKSQDMARLGPDIKALLRDYADNIDSLNPGYEGLLGTGRISVLNSLTQQLTGVNVTNFIAKGAPSKINLSWDANDAASFNLYRHEGIVGSHVRGTHPLASGFVKLNQKPITGLNHCVYSDSGVREGTSYSYIVEAIDAQGHSLFAGPANGSPLGQMYSLSLKGVYPNPVRTQGTVHYTAAGIAGSMVPVRIDVFDISGRLVKTLVNGNVITGENEANLDLNSESMAAGVYTVRLMSEGQSKTTRFVVSH